MSEITVAMATSRGTINLRLFPDIAPLTVCNFVNLAQRGFYDGLNFHRVIPDFMIQGGCPQGTGTGDPGYKFKDEFDPSQRHDRPGRLSMANSGPASNGSQFFITHVPTPWLDDGHTIFGEIVSDADQKIVEAVAQGDAITRVTVSGDTAALLDDHQEQVDKWNAILR